MPAPNVQDRDIALTDIISSYTPISIFAGEQDVVTVPAVVETGQTLTKLQVVAKDPAGNLVAVNPAAADTTKIPVGIISQDVTTTTATSPVAIFIQGFFNYNALTWPASITTLAQAQALMATAPSGVLINIGVPVL